MSQAGRHRATRTVRMQCKYNRRSVSVAASCYCISALQFMPSLRTIPNMYAYSTDPDPSPFLFGASEDFWFPDVPSPAHSLAHTSSIWNIIDESSSLLSCALTSADQKESLRMARLLTSKLSMSHGHYDVGSAQLSSTDSFSLHPRSPRAGCGAGGHRCE